MKFLSMFSGIEAASVAWKPLGWTCAGVCEIEPFPSAVLAHHYPDVPNLGNVETADFDSIGPIDLAVFGSPCQSYSIAGKRLGLDDPRGNLALIAGTVLYRKRPRWFVFENVPGLLSSDKGWDFGTLLATFSGHPPGSVFEPPENGWSNSGIVESFDERSYGLAWRVLDAQYVRVQSHPRAVPQRRRRVFVVGHLGDWRRAAAVLFERESLRRDSPPRRNSGKDVAPTISARTQGGGGLGTDFDCDGGLIADVARCDTASQQRIDAESETFVVSGHGDYRHGLPCLRTQGGDCSHGSEALVAHSLRAEGFDASEDGTGRGTPIVPIAIQERAVSENADAGPDGIGCRDDGAAYTLEARTVTQAVCFNARQDPDSWDGHSGPIDTDGTTQAIAFSTKDYGNDAMSEVSPTLRAMGHYGSHANAGGQVGGVENWAVRRLTPTECERLQGFPDCYTQVPYRGKPAADGPRYKALGNSMAVNVMAWIGERIQMVDEISHELREAAE